MDLVNSFTLVILLFSAASHQKSTPESPTYVAGVVEFTPEPFTVSLVERTKIHIREYEKILLSQEAENVDIIIFPELTLNDLAFPVYVELDSTPCNNMTNDINLMNEISCMAKNIAKYVVINISEKTDCNEAIQESLNDTRPCSSLGITRYNTNVVFDRNGTVISRYRKFNLFREPGTNITLEPEIITFDTDFGVTFGQITCFDILFFQPTMQLVAKGIRDFIFPAMWISELPFLTASQIHSSWAYSNNVNLLTAGTNLAAAGSTGTGIYAGRLGALTSIMTGKSTRRILVSEVPKLKGQKSLILPTAMQIQEETEIDPEIHLVKMGRDFLEEFTTIVLDTENENNLKEIYVCSFTFCCKFDLNYNVINNDNGYKYRLVAFEGPRNFADYAYTSVSVCGLMTCTHETLASCGVFDNQPHSIRFNNISISGIFNDADIGTLVMPNTLNTKFLPLHSNDFSFTTVPNNVGESAMSSKTVISTITLRVTHSDILSFGLYARNYDDFIKMDKLPEEELVTEPDDDTGSAVSLINSKLFTVAIFCCTCTVLKFI